MKKNFQVPVTILLALIVIISGFNGYAKGEDVLLASVDYVDYKFTELSNRISQITITGGTSTTTTTTTSTDPNVTLRVDNVEKQVGAIETNLDAIDSKISFLDQVTLDLSDGSVWQIVELDAGISIYATDTSEIILRSGTAKVIGNKLNEGLSDVTVGTDLKDGTSLTSNHLIIIPRGDGRGVKAVTRCFVMYKGLYYLQ
ncbi:MAG: hypothetical protein JXQ23_12385 [Clostridia bacterium]|nr:hypothetical protein [Clostridia bacterium]